MRCAGSAGRARWPTHQLPFGVDALGHGVAFEAHVPDGNVALLQEVDDVPGKGERGHLHGGPGGREDSAAAKRDLVPDHLLQAHDGVAVQGGEGAGAGHGFIGDGQHHALLWRGVHAQHPEARASRHSLAGEEGREGEKGREME